MNSSWAARATMALFLRPSLWLTACRQVYRLTGRRWWRYLPFLPLPAPAYVRFRTLTQYGELERLPDIADVVTWLVWVKDMDRKWSGSHRELSEPNY